MRVCLLISWLIGLMLPAAHAEPRPPLELVTLQYPPYSYIQAGEPDGVAVQLVKQVFSEMGVTINVRVLPWARAISDIEHGRADAIFTAFKTPKRERFADYSQEVLFVQNISLIQASPKPLAWRQAGNGLSMCAVNNVSYGSYMDQLLTQQHFATVYRINSAEQCALMVSNGRADLWVNNEFGARVLLQQVKLSQPLHILQPPLQSTNSYIAFSRQRQLTAIRDRFDAALRQFKQSGRYQQLVDEAIQSTRPELH
ncbi:ABC transporter substrate-binding protein [Bacterioplanes sanyensis]|nr:ABC transporter substrate-binding protein [Bacterioplanes sanyensis]